MFPAEGNRDGNAELLAATGMDTLEVLARVQASDVDEATLDALRITVDRLCSEYAYVPSEQLVIDGREWLGRVADLRHRRLTLTQHREILTLAGWLALLVGCVEYDSGDQLGAEATRRAALSLGREAENGEIQGWAHEMRAYFSLTTGDYRGVISAAAAGGEVASQHCVAVQLATHKAKAWAMLGDRRRCEDALACGRKLVDSRPHPENVAHHFVVDQAKYDYKAMGCYRILGEDSTASTLAQEVITRTPRRPRRGVGAGR